MKINVGVFFGGKSVEHEVSVITACEAMNALDPNKYNVIPIYITKEGEFYTGKDMFDVKSFKNIPELLDKSTNITISLNEREHTIINNESGLFFKKIIDKIDVAFPIMHGTNGEDGTIQGLFELMNIPYVGPNIIASANGMDKITMKMILKESGLPTVPYLWFFGNTYFDDKETILRGISTTLGFPVIVKPANLGSSVGISTAKNMQELEEAIDTATSYSTKIIVEKFVKNLREINVAVLGDYEEAYTSMCEEPLRSGDILSYNDKYAVGSKGGSKSGSQKGMAASFHKMPADLPEDVAQKFKAYAKMTFIALNCSGNARVDFLMDSSTNEIYVNEINTIPGSLAYYFWEAAGMPFSALLDKLIELAVKKHKEKNKLIFTNNINILSISGKGPKKNANEHKEEINENRRTNDDIDFSPNPTEEISRGKESLLDITKDIKDTFDENNEMYDKENPLLNDDVDYGSEEMSQLTIDEVNKNEFDKVLDSKLSSGQAFDVTVGDDEEAILNNEEEKNVIKNVVKNVKENAKEEKKEIKFITKEEKKNTSEPFGLLKNLVQKPSLDSFENPDAFSNGDLKIKGVKNKKKDNKKNAASKASAQAALDEFFSPDDRI